MRVIVLDAETFFSKDFSLSKLSTEEYVRSPEFACHTWGYWEPARMPQGPVTATPAMLETNDDLRATIASSAVIAHHAAFDGLILEHHYGLKPAFWFDTLSMARLVLPSLRSHSLDALAAHFGLPAKIVPYNEFRGVRHVEGALYGKLADGCKHDVWLTYQIWCRLMRGDY